MNATPTGESVMLMVSGMTCGNCAAHVREVLEGVAGVRAVAVDLDGGRAEVSGAGLDREALADAIRAAGYDVGDGATAGR